MSASTESSAHGTQSPDVAYTLLTPLETVRNLAQETLAGKSGALDDNLREFFTVFADEATEAMRRTGQAIAHYHAGRLEPLGHMMHDLFSPSSTILSYCDLLLEDFTDDLTGDQYQSARFIYYHVHHQRRQAYNLVDYARLHTLPPRQRHALPLQPLLNPGMVKLPHHIAYRWQLPPNLPRVYTSRLYIGRTMINLLTNAFDNTLAGSVTVTGDVQGDAVCISVIDTGRGIVAADMPHIFQPFWRSRDVPYHLGLGLYLAQQHITAQDGTLTIDSDPGNGTHARFTVPIAE